MRKPKRVVIRGPLVKGQKVLRQAPPGEGRWPKQFRWYNPQGEDFQMEVDLDQWIQGRIKDGDIEIVSSADVKPVVSPAPPVDKGKGKKPGVDKE